MANGMAFLGHYRVWEVFGLPTAGLTEVGILPYYSAIVLLMLFCS